ncbi:MAG: hypothetical protein R3C09_12300 [Pirellulaceae bacterium]
MTSTEPATLNQTTELSPWVIITRTAQAGDSTHLAVWRMASGSSQASQSGAAASSELSDERRALALFTDRLAAERYAEQFCAGAATSFQVKQFSSIELMAVLAECYRVGMRYAALNPSGTAARQIFVLRDVLTAVQKQLLSRAREQGKTDDHGNGSDN